jgi:hypothetical protein
MTRSSIFNPPLVVNLADDIIRIHPALCQLDRLAPAKLIVGANGHLDRARPARSQLLFNSP